MVWVYFEKWNFYNTCIARETQAIINRGWRDKLLLKMSWSVFGLGNGDAWMSFVAIGPSLYRMIDNPGWNRDDAVWIFIECMAHQLGHIPWKVVWNFSQKSQSLIPIQIAILVPEAAGEPKLVSCSASMKLLPSPSKSPTTIFVNYCASHSILKQIVSPANII